MRERVYRAGQTWIPVFCASCGRDDGQMIPEANRDFAFYLCELCAERHGSLDGVEMIPDAVWFERVKNAQIEEHGRELQPRELADQLSNPDSPLSLLARDRPLFGQG